MLRFLRSKGAAFPLILCILFGSLGFLARRVADRFLTDETKRKIVCTVVLYVEQVFKDLHGQDKMDAFLEKTSELLTAKGIPFTLEELKVMAEAVLAEFNRAFEKPLNSGATADAVRRVEEYSRFLPGEIGLTASWEGTFGRESRQLSGCRGFYIL